MSKRTLNNITRGLDKTEYQLICHEFDSKDCVHWFLDNSDWQECGPTQMVKRYAGPLPPAADLVLGPGAGRSGHVYHPREYGRPVQSKPLIYMVTCLDNELNCLF